MVLVDAAFGQGSDVIVLADVKCNGTETSLDECLSGDTSSCSHSDEAGIRCIGKMSDPFCPLLKIKYC